VSVEFALRLHALRASANLARRFNGATFPHYKTDFERIESGMYVWGRTSEKEALDLHAVLTTDIMARANPQAEALAADSGTAAPRRLSLYDPFTALCGIEVKVRDIATHLDVWLWSNRACQACVKAA
jgi:hypothetical protein